MTIRMQLMVAWWLFMGTYYAVAIFGGEGEATAALRRAALVMIVGLGSYILVTRKPEG